jgi:hypothetical protein
MRSFGKGLGYGGTMEPARADDGKSEPNVPSRCSLCYNGRAFGNPEGPSRNRREAH